jgi:signal transduction histidine kinase
MVGLMPSIVAVAGLIAGGLFMLISLFARTSSLRLVLLAAVIGGFAGLILVLVRFKQEKAAAIGAVAGVWAACVVSVWTAGGVGAPSVALLSVFVAVAALLLSWRAGIAAIVISVVTAFGMAWAQAGGVLPRRLVVHTPWTQAATLSLAVILVGALALVAVGLQRRAVNRAEHELGERVAAEEALRRRVSELDSLQQVSQLLARRGDLRLAIDDARRVLIDLFAARSVDVRLLASGERAEEAHTGAACATGPASLCVPLIAQDEILGSLDVVRDSEVPFGPREHLLAGTAAELLAAAIMNERLRALETHEAAVGERQRIARDLHDAVTQNIYTANLIAEVLPSTWDKDPAEGRRNLLLLQRAVRAALGEMRTMLHELRPETVPLTPLSTLLGRLADALAGQGEIEVTLEVDDELRLPPSVHVAVYRVAQEALNNVGKYAEASHVLTSVEPEGDGVRLIVRDDGLGFDPAVTPAGMGSGFMRERAEAVDAELSIASAPGSGTTVALVWPAPG